MGPLGDAYVVKVELSWMGLVFLYKRPEKSPSTTSTMWSHSENKAISKEEGSQSDLGLVSLQNCEK